MCSLSLYDIYSLKFFKESHLSFVINLSYINNLQIIMNLYFLKFIYFLIYHVLKIVIKYPNSNYKFIYSFFKDYDLIHL